MKTSDALEKLLERSRRCDREARKRFFSMLAAEERYRAVMFAMARKLLRKDHRARRLIDSHDLVQSALGTGLERFSEFHGESLRSFLSWTRAILRSKVNRVQRRQNQRLQLERLEPGQLGGDDDRDTTLDVSLQEACESLHAGIAELGGDDRRILKLQLMGWNATQVGRVMHLKPAAVRKRRSRALHRLHGILRT